MGWLIRFLGLGLALVLLQRLVARVAGPRRRPGPAPPSTASSGPSPVPGPAPVPPGPPELTAFRPLDRTGPTVPVRFVVSDPGSARVDVRVEYSFGGGGFQAATPAATSDRMTDLPAPDVEADYRFIRNAGADLGVVQGAAQLRFTPLRGAVAGQASTVGCALDTTAPPRPPALPAAPPALGPKLTINAGDNQVGISGRLLAAPLSVQVVDAASRPVSGVKVAWTVAAGTQADIEGDPFRSTLTNAGGLSFARVRFQPGFVGIGGVRATLVGVPDQRADFRVEARKPQILVPTLGGIRARFGESFDIDVQYDADGSRATTDFEPDPVRPVVLRVEAIDAVLLHRELRLPPSPGGSAAARVTLVPTIYAGTVKIHFADAATMVHDSVAQVRSEKQGVWPPVRSDYDGAGRLVKLGYPGGGAVEYRWDRSGRLREVVDGSARFALEWLGLERLLSCSGAGVAWRYDYSDGAGRLLSLSAQGLTAGALAFAVTPDRRGRIAGWTRTAGASTEKVTFAFDSVGRLAEEVHDYAPSRVLAAGFVVTQLRATRVYDGDGVVREQRQDSSGPAARGPRTARQEREERGRVTKIDGTPLAYDRNGNLTRDDRSRTYVWDAWNRLARVEAGGQVLVSFTYDHLGRLISRQDAAGEEQLVYDGWRLLEVRKSGAVVERYVWGLPGQLLVVETGGRRYTVVPRPDGSPDCLVDAQGAVGEHYDFSGFGVTLALDPAGQPVPRPRLRLLFHFRIWDPVAELYLFGVRWYSPRLEQFLGPDPLGPSEGTNHYALCRNDPVNLRDPLGLGVADDVIDYFDVRGQEAGKAAGGATIGLVKIIGEGILQAADLIGASWALASGGKPYRPLSAVGRMADEGLDPGDILVALGKGMIETPERLWAAARRGDSVALGEEALNLYLLGRPVIRAPIAYGANWLVRGIGGLGPRGLRWQIWIRNQQLRRLVLPKVRRIMGSRMPRRLTVEYGGNQGPGRIGNYGADSGIVQVYEAAFTPGWSDFVAMVRNALDAENVGAAAGRYHWRTSLGTRRLLRGLPNDIEGLIHEAYHGYQYESFPDAYESLAEQAGFRDLGPLEFSNPATQLNARFRLAGAHDFAAFAAPPRLLTPLGLAHQIPIAFAAAQPRRRRRW